jgi:hypothetical protein
LIILQKIFEIPYFLHSNTPLILRLTLDLVIGSEGKNACIKTGMKADRSIFIAEY